METTMNNEVCYFCGHTHFQETFVEQTYQVNGKYYLVQSIPARVCKSCGEAVFSLEVGEKIRKILHSEERVPHKTIEMEQYEYA
jgi:HTH-type transcriptional regulator/antitoxin MqsA